jgi:cupin 2 domain-containing protein
MNPKRDATRPRVLNLLRNLPGDHSGEATEILGSTPTMRIERIVSRGHSSPPGFWYDQEWHEWVAVLQGSAVIRFESGSETKMAAGDAIEIPARCRHRVESTDPDIETVWLAVHAPEEISNP